MNNDHILRLWGKTKQDSKDPEKFHPALFHMLDVASVANILLSSNNSLRWRIILSKVLNTEPDTLIDWLPYFIALHDIGKISLPFQSMSKEQVERLKQEGLISSQWTFDIVPHSIISQIYIEQELTKSARKKIAQIFAEAHGGHHGWFPQVEEIRRKRAVLLDEPDIWYQMRKDTDSVLRHSILKYNLGDLSEPTNISAASMAMNGFTILCDWIGSDGRAFEPAPNISLDMYIEQSLYTAKQAVQNAGLNVQTGSSAPTEVNKLFFDIKTPRQLQSAIDEIPEEVLRFPILAIIEAPTGEGKTEAALTLAHRIARLEGSDELYYALPTMATSNQMFGRIQEHLLKRLRLDIPVKLVHGQASLVEEDMRTDALANMIEPLNNGTEKRGEEMESLAWFNSKKRTLIAPFGVGTIDQAELAALNVKHVGLRMMGLAGKIVIIDEVHAYDVYMTTIITRLLNWLAAMNTSVIMLSATLPTSRRRQLAEAYCEGIEINTKADEYPCLMIIPNTLSVPTWTPDHKIGVWQPERKIEIQAIHFGDDEEQVEAMAQWLLKKISNGGCACYIANTVKRAQKIYQAVKNHIKDSRDIVDLDLVHSQFPLDERIRREEELKEKYGKKEKQSRPEKGIVIGTQVLEQSLDLDFDLMVSDLAPIDLLLQRAGRLHRHERKQRSSAYGIPRLWINYEIDGAGVLKKGPDFKIYSRYIMLQTYHLLAERINQHIPINLPNDYRGLIETVYSERPPFENSQLYDDWLELGSQQNLAEGEAKYRLIPKPHQRDSFAKTVSSHIKFEEDEKGTAWITAKTRLGEETMNIIPLERNGDWTFYGANNEKVNINMEAPLEIQRQLLTRNMRISHPDAIKAIHNDVERRRTVLFNKSILLKSYFPIWLTLGETYIPMEKYRLHIRLDPYLGLLIEKEKKSDDKSQ